MAANPTESRTVIAIAHRPSTLQDLHRIVVLKDGGMAQDGSPEMLSHKEGFHRELIKEESMALALAAARPLNTSRRQQPNVS